MNESNHPTTCMRHAAAKMGRTLFSVQAFVHDALYWLSAHGAVTIECIPEEVGDPSWLCSVGGHVHSGGHSLAEAVCGAVHAIEEHE